MLDEMKVADECIQIIRESWNDQGRNMLPSWSMLYFEVCRTNIIAISDGMNDYMVGIYAD